MLEFMRIAPWEEVTLIEPVVAASSVPKAMFPHALMVMLDSLDLKFPRAATPGCWLVPCSRPEIDIVPEVSIVSSRLRNTMGPLVAISSRFQPIGRIAVPGLPFRPRLAIVRAGALIVNVVIPPVVVIVSVPIALSNGTITGWEGLVLLL